MNLLRHLLSILLLPFVVVVVVPYWILSSYISVDTGWILRPVGLLVFAGGLALFTWCVRLFANVGKGTLAPWDPTRKLVAVGPYRYMRNPMISAVATMLIGETIFWWSPALCLWVVLFILFNHVYFVLSEEPGLERRFGESYRTYKANVPRWFPRLKPWQNNNYEKR